MMTFVSDDCSLRPMTDRDLRLVLDWRNSDPVRSQMFTDHLISWQEHTEWWNRVKDDPSRRDFVFELAGTPVGVVNITEVEPTHGTATWGYYRSPESGPPGVGRLLAFFAFTEVFDVMRLRKLWSEVFSTNESSLRLHEDFGFVQEGLFREQRLHGDTHEDVVRLALYSHKWAQVREDMECALFGQQR